MKNVFDLPVRFFSSLLLLWVILANSLPADQTRPHPLVHLNEKTFTVSIADTGESRRTGLSGSPPLPALYGLLFVFDRDGRHAIWMKDMLFSLDIIWINCDGVVVHIEKKVSPDTYPRAFFPPVPARYVLEVSAGNSEGVTQGTMARFENIPSGCNSGNQLKTSLQGQSFNFAMSA